MGGSSLVRMLTFRLDAAGYAALGWREARVGSVVYVFALSALLWLMLRPLGAHRRSYAALAWYAWNAR